jgi:hypothetical protein
VGGTEYLYILRFQPKETGESLIGLPGAEVPSESKPEPGVSSDMRAVRQVSICGSRRLRRPSTSSSPGSVANLHWKIRGKKKKRMEGRDAHAL